MVVRYSLKKNMGYMATAFYKPRQLIDQLLREESSLYYVFPFVLYTLIGEVFNLVAAAQNLSPQYTANPFTSLLPVPERNYYYLKLVLFPCLNMMALALFTLVIYLFSRLPRFRSVSAKRCALFLMFLSTIGIVLLLAETPWSPETVKFFAPPIGGLVSLVYLAGFIHKHAHIGKASSILISIVSLAFYFTFRGLTMR